MVAVNADALVRLTRAVLAGISPTPAPDYPSRVRPPRQQSRVAVGAQFVMVAGLVYRRPIRSILLSCNRFTKAFDGQSARQGSELANPEPGSPCGQRNSCTIAIIHEGVVANAKGRRGWLHRDWVSGPTLVRLWRSARWRYWS